MSISFKIKSLSTIEREKFDKLYNKAIKTFELWLKSIEIGDKQFEFASRKLDEAKQNLYNEFIFLNGVLLTDIKYLIK